MFWNVSSGTVVRAVLSKNLPVVKGTRRRRRHVSQETAHIIPILRAFYMASRPPLIFECGWTAYGAPCPLPRFVMWMIDAAICWRTARYQLILSS